MFKINGKSAGKAVAAASSKKSIGFMIKRDKYLLLLLAPAVILFILFCYVPMYGVLIAFKDFKTAANGLLSGPWVGFKWFVRFFEGYYSGRVIRNTILLNIYSILWGFPVPIIFALLLNELKTGLFKRVVQTVSYLPHFISMVIVVGMTINFLSPSTGIINIFIKALGFEPINFLMDPKWFRTVYIATGIWQGFGWGSIIYLAQITSIDPMLYEASKIDGANRLRQIFHITIPGILPTVVVLLILELGSIMSVGFEKILLLYNPATYEVADVISTYTYRIGLLGSEFSFGTAVGLFNAVVNVIILVTVNKISRKISDISLW